MKTYKEKITKLLLCRLVISFKRFENKLNLEFSI